MPTKQQRPAGFFGSEARTASSDERVSLFRFVSPRYWRSWVFIAWLRFCSWLPWRWSLALHQRLGRWLGRKSRKARTLVRENLERCFPEWDDIRREAVTDEYFANMGAMCTELALAWFRSPRRTRKLVEAEGVEHVQAALARNRGVILLVGHFTSLEMSGIGIDKYVPGFVIIQNPRRSQLLTEVQRRGRARFSDAVYSNRNARALLRSLRNNAAVLIAADEADTSKSSILLPFFGHPALANTSVSRIATISGASVVPLSYCRAADDSGYRIRFYPALEDFPSNDIVADTERLIAILEAQIRECPGQYFWKQRRFRSRESSQQ